MSRSFDEKLQELHQRYSGLTMEERRELMDKIKHKNLLKYRKMERMKHDLLRMEAKRTQLEMEDNQKELSDCESRILEKKEAFLKLIHDQVK